MRSSLLGALAGSRLQRTDRSTWSWIADRLPRRWVATPRRRRILFLLVAAPGFVGVFATPLHRSLAVLAAGGLLFAAALIFRRRTEPVFARADTVAPDEPPPPVPAVHGH